MSKTLKKTMADELTTAFSGLKDFVLVDYMGLKAEEAAELRDKLRDQKMRLRVVKNSILMRAFMNAGFVKSDAVMNGPTAVISGGDGGAIAICRALDAWNKKAKKISYKGGMIDGTAGGAKEAATWSSLPSRTEVLSQILGVIIAPASGIAGLLQSTLAAFPMLVQAHIAKMEGQGQK